MKHRWERLDINGFICIRCGWVKHTITDHPDNRRGFHFTKFERIDVATTIGLKKNGPRTPPCDGVWPDDWKPARKYMMFLDDIREPPKPPKGKLWIVMRSFAEATAYVERFGMPKFISFDHDLGEADAPTGYDFAHWIVDRHLDNVEELPENFSYTVHSANPPGAANIKGLLDSFIQFRDLQKAREERNA